MELIDLIILTLILLSIISLYIYVCKTDKNIIEYFSDNYY